VVLIFIFAYFSYTRFLTKKYALNDENPTPAHTFYATNQLLAALTLLVIIVWLKGSKRGRKKLLFYFYQ